MYLCPEKPTEIYTVVDQPPSKRAQASVDHDQKGKSVRTHKTTRHLSRCTCNCVDDTWSCVPWANGHIYHDRLRCHLHNLGNTKKRLNNKSSVIPCNTIGDVCTRQWLRKRKRDQTESSLQNNYPNWHSRQMRNALKTSSLSDRKKFNKKWKIQKNQKKQKKVNIKKIKKLTKGFFFQKNEKIKKSKNRKIKFWKKFKSKKKTFFLKKK